MKWLHRLLFPKCESEHIDSHAIIAELKSQNENLISIVAKYIEKKREESPSPDAKNERNTVVQPSGGPRFWPPEVRAAVLSDFNQDATTNSANRR